MDTAIAYGFRFVMYTFFGLTLESVFAVDGIERALGCAVHRRVPRKYLEGFVSLYMIPLHGLGLLFAVEPLRDASRDWPWPARLVLWAVAITAAEAGWGWIQDKVLGFYTWDYYADSKWKVFQRGYTLWTLVPLWGLIGMVLEVYTDLMRFLSPFVVQFFGA
jgi:hypothetical protein